MPPRIPCTAAPQPICAQCLHTRSNFQPRVGTPASSKYAFHTTQPTHTRLRRNMFAWLNGPGKALRKPLPGSTNYLGAYDKQGNLTRAKRGAMEAASAKDADLDQDESVLLEQDRRAGLSEQQIQRRAGERVRRRTEKAEREASGGLPKEGARDLRPYPLNHSFQSQAVLSEPLRERIHALVTQGVDLKSVSAAFGVDIRRVAAVVRLMTVEKNWVKEGKTLAKPYNNAVLAMLPTTPLNERFQQPHEPINDLPVHPYTRQQMFVPTSESRVFTRADAAKAFHPKLLPADERIAHPELLQIAKWELEGHDRETRHRLTRERDAEAALKREAKEKKQKEWERRTQVVVPGRRWDFKFQDISAEEVDKDGRGRRAIGIRYGMPREDRKKGQVKIPTSVE